MPTTEDPARLALRQAAKLRGACQQFWDTLGLVETSTLGRDEYVYVHSRLSMALAPDLSEEDALLAAAEDWRDDIGSQAAEAAEGAEARPRPGLGPSRRDDQAAEAQTSGVAKKTRRFFFPLPRLLPRGFLLCGLKRAGQWKAPRAVPPDPAPRFPQTPLRGSPWVSLA